MLQDVSSLIRVIFSLLLVAPVTCRAAVPSPAIKSTLNRQNANATSTSHSVIFGCTLWFTGPNNDIPVQTTGYATLAPISSGGPELITPCGAFLSDVVKDIPVQSTEKLSVTPSAINSEPSTARFSSDSLYSTGSPNSNASVSYPSVGVTSSYRGPRPPNFRGSGLTGCYAMTGGATVLTIQSGDPLPGSQGWYSEATKDLPMSFACSDFLAFPQLPSSVLAPFQRNQVCTSYLSWAKENPAVPETVYPPGVFNHAGFGDWNCTGGCYMNIESLSVLYFSTRSYDGCSAITSTTSADPSITKYAVVDGSTLTYPSLYLAIKGGVTVYDGIQTLGKVHMNPTIAIPPGGLSSLSFLDTLQADPGAGQTTVPYDPGIPSSCESFEFQHPASGLETYHFVDGSTAVQSEEGVMLSSNQMFLAPPIELLTLDPAWRTCSWITDGSQHAWTYGVVDPPREIHTEAEMMGPSQPSPTPAPGSGSIPNVAPSPGATGVPDQPIATSDPASKPSQVAPSDSKQHLDPNASDPGSNPSQVGFGGNENEDPGSSVQGDPKGQGSIVQFGKGDPLNNGPGVSGQKPTVVNLASAFAASAPSNTQPQAPSLGGIIYNAFNTAPSSSFAVGEQDPPAASSLPLADPKSTPPPIMTVANHAIAVNQESHYLSIGTTKLAPGGAGITLSGTPMTLDNSYNLIIGTPATQAGNLEAGNPIAGNPAQSEILPTPDSSSANAKGIAPGIADPSIGIAPAFANVMSSAAEGAVPYDSGATATPAGTALDTAAGEVVTPNPSDIVAGSMTGSSREEQMTSFGTSVGLISTSDAFASDSGAQNSDGKATKVSSTVTSPSGNSANNIQTSSNGATPGEGGGSASVPFTATSATASKTTQAGRAVAGQTLGTYIKGILGMHIIFAMII